MASLVELAASEAIVCALSEASLAISPALSAAEVTASPVFLTDSLTVSLTLEALSCIVCLDSSLQPVTAKVTRTTDRKPSNFIFNIMFSKGLINFDRG
jgi:hypothetical protein